MGRISPGQGLLRALLAAALPLSCAACGTIRMAEIAFADDRTASVKSAWRTEEGGLALFLDGMETGWSEGEALLTLSNPELESALGGRGAEADDIALVPVVLLPRSRLVRGWSRSDPGGPTLEGEVAVERSDRKGWSAAAAGSQEGLSADLVRIVYRVDHSAPDDPDEHLLACMVVSPQAAPGSVRRAVFVVEGLDKGLLRGSALIGFGVLVDLALLAVLTL
jgi:hypothetical protein